MGRIYSEEFKQLQQESAKSAARLEQVQVEVVRQRASYFERVGLLCGGAIVLSITFVGYILSRPSPIPIWTGLLYGAWAVLLLGLLAAMLRNHQHQGYFYYTGVLPLLRARVQIYELEIEIVEKTDQVFVNPDQTPMSDMERKEFAGTLRARNTELSGQRIKAERGERRTEFLWKSAEYVSQACFVIGLMLLALFAFT